MLRAALLATTSLLIGVSAAGAHPLASRAVSATCADANPAATAAVNRLLAGPWAGLSAQNAREAEAKMESDLEDEWLFNKSGGGTLNYRIRAKTEDVEATISLGTPPGFTAVSPSCFDLRAPISGDWGFQLRTRIEASARVRIGGENIFSISPTRQLNLRISGNVAAGAAFNLADPTRPRLQEATLKPVFRVTADGFFDLNAALNATVLVDGTIEFRHPVANLGLSYGSVSASVDGDLIIALKPSGGVAGAFANLQADVGSAVRESPYVVGDTVDVHTAYQKVEVRLEGRVKASLKRVGSVSGAWSLKFNGVIPSSGDLLEIQQMIGKGLPIRWGDQVIAAGALSKETRPLDFGAEARIVDAGAQAHMPWDNVVSLLPVSRFGSRMTQYSGQKDSAIWTGHYLAAQAFRYAATREPQALERIRKSLTGIERLFDVPALGATHGQEKQLGTGPATDRTRVAAAVGVLARTAVPDTHDVWDAGPIAEKKCWYELPENGWRYGGRTYRSWAQVFAAESRDRIDVTLIEPVAGRVWRGWGCGGDWPVSRDQYISVIYGLAATWLFVDDSQIKERVRQRLENAIGFLVANKWNVVLPPKNRIETSFIGDFAKQLAILRIGATINPARFGQAYSDVAAASAHTWIPTWFSAIDPLFQYYKFNLSNAALGVALLYEPDAARRAGFLWAHEQLWGSVRQHRNAYFGLLHILAQAPAQRASVASSRSWLNRPGGTLTLTDEIVRTLAEWTDRRKAVAGPNGLPRDDISPEGIAFQADLFRGGVGRYQGIERTESWQALSALPVHMRAGTNMDFIWQRHPFNVGYDNSLRRIDARPDENDVHNRAARARERSRESPGVDYLLPYWIAVYLGVLPKPSAP